jgi:NDP-sugar pyrophosphorylase family protein
MTDLAVVMAGGRSARMRATAGPRHKALVTVGGMTLIEFNVRQLVAAGFRDLIVVTAAAEPELTAYVDEYLAPLAATLSASLARRTESAPLGNIGFVGTIDRRVDDALVVYVDNLTTLDLRKLLALHRERGHDLTIAVHEEPFNFPYGVLDVRAGRVVAYDEKPLLRARISSGTCVVGRAARDLIPAGERLDARDLFRLLADRGRIVGAYEHSAPWIDVNEGEAIERAEQLIASHAAAFAESLIF